MKWMCALLVSSPLLAACAAAPASPRGTDAKVVSVRDEMKSFRESQDRVLSKGYDEEADLDAADLAHRRRWMARFRELTRCGDPVEEDRAYAAWALLLANLENADLDEGAGREALPLFREWSARFPESAEMGGCLWMLVDTATEAENDEVLRLLRDLSGSPTEGIARGALAARADLLEYLDRRPEAADLLEEVVSRWPDSSEARNARRELKGMTLTPGAEAPAFALRDLRGREVSLASLRGRVVLLVFFSFG